MLVFSLIFVFLNPDFWLPNGQFDEKYSPDTLARVRDNERNAARCAFELFNTAPGTPQHDILKQELDHWLFFLGASQRTLDRVRPFKREAMWRAALKKVGRHIGP